MHSLGLYQYVVCFPFPIDPPKLLQPKKIILPHLIKYKFCLYHVHELDRLIIYGSRIFHLYGDVTIVGEGLQNLFSGPLNREESLSCHTCCDTGPQFFLSDLKDRPVQSPLMTNMGMWRTYSNLDPHRVTSP
jgi:hypothetical protein